MSAETQAKTDRTLVAINLEHVIQQKIDLSFLEKHRHVTAWFFFRNEVIIYTNQQQDFKAGVFFIPSYEKDAADYIVKLLIFEVARNPQYSKVLLAGAATERFEAGVAFLQNHDIAAEFVPIHYIDGSPLLPHAPLPPEPVEADDDYEPPLVPGKRRRKLKYPTDPASMEAIMAALMAEFKVGQEYKRSALSPMIHRGTGKNVKDLFKHKNLTGLFRYLERAGIVKPAADSRNFIVLRNRWKPDPSQSPLSA